MTMHAVTFAFIIIGLAVLLTLWRLIRGPSMADRVLALDTLTILAIPLIILYGLFIKGTFYIEAALFLAMTGFIATVALSKFAINRTIMRGGSDD